MSAKETLHSIIENFNLAKFETFFREKNNRLRFPNEPLYFGDDNFTDGIKLAEGNLEDGNLSVCAFKSLKELSERSSKKDQYTLGKKVLKDEQTDSGIFIFYDDKGRFRFSLIYVDYSGTRRDFSTFKRFTYFVSKEQTDKTFLKQIGEGDLSTIAKIKEAFSVDKVTKEFYTEIANWYFWAVDKVKFPDAQQDPINLIRLIARLIFIWFLKEKDLIPNDLFSEAKLKTVVKDFMKNSSASNFYNAILQNLFFATLNQKMDERGFAEDNGYPANKKTYGVKNLYRYENKFLISKEEVIKLFKDIPFLNGGLFDCLDKIDDTGKVIYIDGFSRNPSKQAIIPDYLFFQREEQKEDLSSYYGVGSRKFVRGLIEILNSYNFTVDENTPIDQEIALDPELLGKVFENLLASYNPETATSARKATGSYYTPREIVDYMVETSVLEYLKEKLPNVPEEKIKLLISYSDNVPEFSEDEKQLIISIIDEIKIIDPACGSGAFPMGILQRLVYVLQKLDLDNKYWHELQFNKAVNESQEVFRKTNKKEREERLKEINEIFDESINFPDYSRKLYLIENCIYGVDIQTIAIQISKLRFFISLVIDQKIDKSRENFGIRPLPNLETKFVAANTLIMLDETQHLANTDEVEKLKDEIKDIRHEYFYAKTRDEKLNCQRKDKELRELLAATLKSLKFSAGSAEKIANFDLFDQNTHADWFDPEWMFGVKSGFDIVIGNPPYIQLQKAFNQKMKYADLYKNLNYETFDRMGDIYCLFYERGVQLLKLNGHLCYISSNKWMRAGYGEKLRKFFLKYNPKVLVDLGPNVFESSTVDTNILLIQKSENKNKLKAVTINESKKNNIKIAEILKDNGVALFKLSKDAWFIGSDAEQRLKEKIERIGKPLKDWNVNIYYGIKTGLNEAFIIDNAKREEILKNCRDSEERKRTEAIIKPILRGRDIKRYYYEWAGLWVIGTFPALNLNIENYPALKKYFLDNFDIRQLEQSGKKYPELGFDARKMTGNKWFETQDQIAYHSEFEKEKVVWTPVNSEYSFAIIPSGVYFVNSVFMITGSKIKMFCGIFNSIFIRYYLTFLFSSEEEYTYASKEIMKKIPLPSITSSNEQLVTQIELLVDKIITAKKQNPQADTSALEREIDNLVYKLYDLTPAEINIIESNIEKGG